MIPEPAIDRLAAMFRTPDLTGTRYEIISTLGRGGMGVVYLARDTALDREVALKIFDRPPGDANEARIIARLEHPGIVPVHDVGRLPDGRVFYAMRFVEGRPLHRELTGVRELPARLRLFVRVCEAVAFAHDRGVLHRDLKPENVMVGPFGEVLVMDWGVAHVVGASAGAEIVGTPGFMSPEQAAGSDVDTRSDVWSLGALLRFLLPDEAPKALRSIVGKATAADPAGRYAGVLEIVADVNRYLDGLRVEAHDEGWSDRARRLYARHRVAFWLVATYLIVRGAMLVVLGR